MTEYAQRLSENLDKCKSNLDTSYTAFAKLLTDFKMDHPDRGSEKFKQLPVCSSVCAYARIYKNIA